MPAADLTGKRFGRRRVTGRAGEDAHRRVLWACVCACGTVPPPVAGASLRSGGTRSCGCRRAETNAARRPTRRECGRCGAAFAGKGSARYCGAECRAAAKAAQVRASRLLADPIIAAGVEAARKDHRRRGKRASLHGPVMPAHLTATRREG